MKPNSSVAYKMTQIVVVVTFLLGIGIASILVVQDYRQRFEGMFTQAHQLLASTRNTAFKAVYAFDQDLAAEIGKGLFEFELIGRVTILDENGEIMMAIQRDRAPLPSSFLMQFLFEDRYILSLPLNDPYDANRMYGELSIHVTPHLVADAFLLQVLNIFIGTLTQAGAVALLILLICYRMVTRPLYRLVEQFNTIDPTSPGKASLAVPNRVRGTEFQAVIAAGNTMLDMISRQLQAKDTAQQIIRRQKEQTERYLAIAEAIIVQLDRDGRVIMLNQRGLEVLDYRDRDIIGQDWFSLVIARRSQDSERQRFQRFISGERGALFYTEGYVITRRGQTRRIIWHIALDYNTRSEVTGVLCSGQDVTDLLATEAALRTSEGNLRRIIEATSQGFAVINQADLTIVDVNTAFHALLGYTRDDVIGQPFVTFVMPKDHARLSFEAHETTTRHEHLDIQMLHREGQDRFVELRLSNLVQGSDGQLQSVAFINDVTERRLDQEKQKFLEDQLRQAQKMETIGTLAGGIAHDFNNILTPILGYSMILQDRFDPEDRNYGRIQKIAQSAQRASDMVKKILTFSRRNEGDVQPTILNDLIYECEILLETRKPDEVTLHIKEAKDDVIIMGDETQVQQVIMNLMTNAYQAFPPFKKGTVTVRVGKAWPSEHELLHSTILKKQLYGYVSVEDTGQGMDRETVSRIFEPFYTTKKSGEGTGLGMAIVHGIVTGHNGDVFVTSERVKGTTCRVYFPLSTEQPVEEVLDPIPLQGQRELIMVVDDEPLNGKFIAEVLEDMNYRYEVYSNSLQALDTYMRKAEDYSLLLTDQTMPQLSGDQLVKAIHEVTPDFPIIMMSGYDKVVDHDNAQDFGVDVYLQKPITPDVLLRAMAGILREKS